MHSLQNKKENEVYGYRLDMEKTFDRNAWKFIEKCFRELGFYD